MVDIWARIVTDPDLALELADAEWHVFATAPHYLCRGAQRLVAPMDLRWTLDGQGPPCVRAALEMVPGASEIGGAVVSWLSSTGMMVRRRAVIGIEWRTPAPSRKSQVWIEAVLASGAPPP